MSRHRPQLLAAFCLLGSHALAQQDVVAFSATSRAGKTVLAWQNPAAPPYGSTRVIGRNDRVPVDGDDVDEAFVANVDSGLGGVGSAEHKNVPAATTYFYGVFVDDGSASYSAGKFVTVDPFPASSPVKWRSGPRQSLYLATESTVWGMRDVGPVINELWRHSGISGPSIVLYPPGSTYLWVGSSDGRLYQIDVTSGNPPQPPDSTSVVLGNGNAGVGGPSYDIFHGLLYVGTEDGSLYAVSVPF